MVTLPLLLVEEIQATITIIAKFNLVTSLRLKVFSHKQFQILKFAESNIVQQLH